jgi:hypothetical protein
MALPQVVRLARTSTMPVPTAVNAAVTVPQPPPGTQPLICADVDGVPSGRSTSARARYTGQPAVRSYYEHQ